MEPERQVYIPEPTLVLFHASDAFVRGVLGPVGSGKSVGMCIEIFFRGLEIDASPRDIIRRSRWAVVRNTYGELKSTTIKTWEDWMPMAKPVYDSPIRWRWQRSDIGDGTGVDLEVFFIALDRPDEVKKLKSMELTGVWINEAVELPKAVLDMATQRVGRYPRKVDCPNGFWNGVIMDTNACDDDHWWYQAAEEQTPRGWEFWRQPPALLKINGEWVANEGQKPGVPRAENAENQPKGFRYWLDLIQGKSDEWINVYCGAQYGAIHEGRPVYPEYDDARHCAKEDLKAAPGIKLTLSWDFGLTPACAISQRMPSGQLRVIDEKAVTEHGAMGIKQFSTQVVLPHLEEHYKAFLDRGNIESFSDPAGMTPSETDEKSCVEALNDVFSQYGVTTYPTRTNRFLPRKNAVADLLVADLDRQPAFLLSPKCRMLRKGFRGSYKYERVQVSGDERYRDEPLKNIYSHIHDALQYGALADSVCTSFDKGAVDEVAE